MFKSIVVPLTGFESDRAALDTAYLAAQSFDSHIEGLWVRPNPVHFTVGAVESFFVNEATAAAFLAEDELRTKAALIAFADFCADRKLTLADTPGYEGGSATLREMTGDAAKTTIVQSRFHDLVVLGRPPRASGLSTRGIGAVLIGSGRPVLLAPERAPKNLGTTIAVAWKDAPEAARALSVAMAFLAKAGKILVLAADEDGADIGAAMGSAARVANLLHWNGLNAEAHNVTSGGKPLSDAVLSAAEALGADLLVMGAYGHSRASELMFGGFTRRVLAASPLPALMVH